jgi:hypothetical protein
MGLYYRYQLHHTKGATTMEKCEKHPEVKMAFVCGEPACGMCFAELMEREKMAAPKPPKAVHFALPHAGEERMKPGPEFEALCNRVRELAGLPPLF